jgi:hypothetical protein
MPKRVSGSSRRLRKTNSWVLRPATSGLSTSTVRFQMGQERVFLPLPTRRTAGELLQVMASIVRCAASSTRAPLL